MSIHEVQIAGDWASIESVKPYAKANIAKKRELLQRKVVRLTRPAPGPFKTEMTLYDEYRREFPIAAEPSEFRGIIEAEVRRALEWMRVRDALSERHQRLVGLLSDIKGDLGSAEWGTPEHGEEILMGLIDKYYPKIKAALAGEESGCECGGSLRPLVSVCTKCGKQKDGK